MIDRFVSKASCWIPAASVTVLLVSGCAVVDVEQDIESVLNEYRTQASLMASEDHRTRWKPEDKEAVPNEFSPWWAKPVHDGLFEDHQRAPITLEQLYVGALENSYQIRVFSDLPLIRRTGVREAKGVFDTNWFAELKYDHVDEAVGSTLQTGGPPRFEEESYMARTGLRKKFITGTEVEVSQELSRTHNNSRFFIPDPQGRAELKLRVVQPLLRGAGINYNTSVIRIAKIDAEIAKSEFIRQSESHLLEVTRSYWALYVARAAFQQKRELVERTSKVVEEIEARSDFDALQSHISRARAAFAQRKADLVRSELAVKNAQDRIRALVNDPSLPHAGVAEMIPHDRPYSKPVAADLVKAAYIALDYRPEIAQAFLQLRSASIRLGMARNEVLPSVNLILEGSLDGLAPNGDIPRAVDRQHSVGGTSYSMGIRADYPLENNTGLARLERRKVEMRQQFNQLKTTIETILLELKVSVREVKTAYRDVEAKYESMLAAHDELQNLEERRGLDSDFDAVSTSTYLGFLLDSQERLSMAEQEYVIALSTYNVAIVNLERAKGTLLSYRDVNVYEKRGVDGLPQLYLAMQGTEAEHKFAGERIFQVAGKTPIDPDKLNARAEAVAMVDQTVDELNAAKLEISERESPVTADVDSMVASKEKVESDGETATVTKPESPVVDKPSLKETAPAEFVPTRLPNKKEDAPEEEPHASHREPYSLDPLAAKPSVMGGIDDVGFFSLIGLAFLLIIGGAWTFFWRN